MNSLISLSYSGQNKSFVFEPLWSSFVFSEVFLFIQSKPTIIRNNSSVVVPADIIYELSNKIGLLLTRLLYETYSAPTRQDLENYPNRFESIFIEGHEYIVNYRTDYNGRLCFALYSIIMFFSRCVDSKNDLIIFFD